MNLIPLMLPVFLLIFVVSIIGGILGAITGALRRANRTAEYHDYLRTDDWKRKRYLVLKRDRWRCVYCGARATQVHHREYAPVNIGHEPIDLLVSVCKRCHESQHGR